MVRGASKIGNHEKLDAGALLQCFGGEVGEHPTPRWGVGGRQDDGRNGSISPRPPSISRPRPPNRCKCPALCGAFFSGPMRPCMHSRGLQEHSPRGPLGRINHPQFSPLSPVSFRARPPAPPKSRLGSPLSQNRISVGHSDAGNVARDWIRQHHERAGEFGRLCRPLHGNLFAEIDERLRSSMG